TPSYCGRDFFFGFPTGRSFDRSVFVSSPASVPADDAPVKRRGPAKVVGDRVQLLPESFHKPVDLRLRSDLPDVLDALHVVRGIAVDRGTRPALAWHEAEAMRENAVLRVRRREVIAPVAAQDALLGDHPPEGKTADLLDLLGPQQPLGVGAEYDARVGH